METRDIVRWITADLNYTRPGWTITAVPCPCPHVDIEAEWPLLIVSYTEPDTTPGGTGEPFCQTRRVLMDPREIADEDYLLAVVTGHILWSVIHEERERILISGKAPYFPHYPHTIETWETDRALILEQVA